MVTKFWIPNYSQTFTKTWETLFIDCGKPIESKNVFTNAIFNNKLFQTKTCIYLSVSLFLNSLKMNESYEIRF